MVTIQARRDLSRQSMGQFLWTIRDFRHVVWGRRTATFKNNWSIVSGQSLLNPNQKTRRSPVAVPHQAIAGKKRQEDQQDRQHQDLTRFVAEHCWFLKGQAIDGACGGRFGLFGDRITAYLLPCLARQTIQLVYLHRPTMICEFQPVGQKKPKAHEMSLAPSSNRQVAHPKCSPLLY